MVSSELISEDIATLREMIRANNGANVASGPFARKVDQLISDFYDDIGELRASTNARKRGSTLTTVPVPNVTASAV